MPATFKTIAIRVSPSVDDPEDVAFIAAKMARVEAIAARLLALREGDTETVDHAKKGRSRWLS